MTFNYPDFIHISEVPDMLHYFREIYGRAARSSLLVYRVYDIGSWDMEADDSITIPLGDDLNLEDFKRGTSIQVMISNDDETTLYDASLGSDFVRGEVNSTDIILTRTIGGFFDTPDFNDISINRGKVTLCLTT